MHTQIRPALPAFSREALFSQSHAMRRRFMLDLVLVPVLLAGTAWLVALAAGTTGQTRMIAVVLTAVVSPMVAGVVAELRVRRRSPRCPGCGARLVSSGGRLHLSGDACARCGVTLVGAGPTAPPVLPSCAEFMARYEALARPYSRWMWISGGTFAVTAAGIYALEYGWLPPSFEPVVIALGLSIPVSVSLVWWRTTRFAVRAAGLNCPTCNDPLVGGPGGSLTRHTLGTGTCPWCHAAVWR